ncbi:MAG: peptidoglycan-associated lipoprotein Pal [Alphaproteobacteria bacterium]|nr:peptidoglycan-associated lipoprotein Pal [Alphaproteobacteria bacterium]
MRIATTIKLGVVVLAMGFLAACSSTKEEKPQVSGPTTSTVQPGSQEDLKVNVGDTVYFDFDSHAIRADAQATLQKQAAWLQKYPQVRLVVEGHCDERGTREYNLALGDRRAYAVKEFLVSLGVDANRLTTKSYGKERPVCSESDEACWAQNRRGYSLVVGGAGS